MIIGLIGLKRSGKDSVATVLCEQHGYTRFAFADSLKDVCLRINPFIPVEPSVSLRLAEVIRVSGWEQAKDDFPEVRQLLQDTGMAIRAYDPEFFTRIVRTAISQHLAATRAHHHNVVISDMRFPNEIDVITGFAGALIRVERPGLPDDVSLTGTHISETGLKDACVDTTLVNDQGLKDLPDKVAGVLDELTHHNHNAMAMNPS